MTTKFGKICLNCENYGEDSLVARVLLEVYIPYSRRNKARGEKHALRWNVLLQLGLNLWISQAPRASTQTERGLLELEAMECFEQVASERTQLARESLSSPRTI